MKNKVQYNRESLLSTLSNLGIEKVDNQIVTKFYNRTISTVKVSNKYEIFDFYAYIKHILPIIESNFKIDSYQLILKGGRQFLRLYSDSIDKSISGRPETFSKTFNITSSSDKSRALTFNLGLFIKSSGTHIIGLSEARTYKKHLIGVTDHIDTFEDKIQTENFNEQIELITKLSNHKISLKDIHEVIYTNNVKANWDRFLAFKRVIQSRYTWNDAQSNILCNQDVNFQYDNSIQIDAYEAFVLYMGLYRNEDSYIISKETTRFLGIREVIKRNNKLKMVLNS